MVKTINAVAPREAIIAVSVRTSRKSKIINIATVASEHCKIYLIIFLRNFISNIRTYFTCLLSKIFFITTTYAISY